MFEPLDAFDVQVVRWLVEQQHIGPLQQYLGQFDTHAPTTRKLAGGAFEVGLAESQTYEGAFQFGLVVCTPHHVETFVELGEAFHQCHVVGTLVVGALGQLMVHPVQFVLHLVDVAEGQLGFLANGAFVGQLHHLRQVADSGFARDADGAASGLLQTGDYLQHGALAGSVLSDKGNAVAGVNYITNPCEQRLGTEFDKKIVNGNHRKKSPSPFGGGVS